jgi:hypothetical protein
MDGIKDTAITILSTIAAIGIISIPVWLFWNWLIPNILGLPYIDYLEAFGITAFTNYTNAILKSDYQKK